MSDMFNPLCGGIVGGINAGQGKGARKMSADSSDGLFNTSGGADVAIFNHTFTAQPKPALNTRKLTLEATAKASKMDVSAMSVDNGPLCGDLMKALMSGELPEEAWAMA